MIKAILAAIVMALLSWGLSYSGVWWMMPVVCFALAVVLRLRTGIAFLTGFAAISVLWFLLLYLADRANSHILSRKMAQLFSLPGHYIFLIVNAALGGIIGGLGAWTGALVRRAFFK